MYRGIKEEDMAKDFEQLPHTADIKLRVYGATLADLFRNALVGMFQAVRPVAPGCRVENDRVVCAMLSVKHPIRVESYDVESLLVDFLSEALYLSDVHDEAYLDAEIHSVSKNNVEATIHGVSVNRFEVVEIKAVTYHDLAVKQTDGGWQVDIVFDI